MVTINKEEGVKESSGARSSSEKGVAVTEWGDEDAQPHP